MVISLSRSGEGPGGQLLRETRRLASFSSASPTSPSFAAPRLDPWRLRVFPGMVFLGKGGRSQLLGIQGDPRRSAASIVDDTTELVTLVKPRPRIRGSVLVARRRHVPALYDLLDDLACPILVTVRRTAQGGG